MENHRQIKLGEILEQLIQARGFSRNRKKLCDALGISVSALSQYLHNQSKPSFDTLVALANVFGVSLDYLVFGVETRQTQPVDYGPLARYMDRTLANLQAKHDERTWLFSRIAHVLIEQIDNAASQIVSTANLRAGVLTDEETMVIEGCSIESCILTMNLQYDVIKPDEGVEVPGRFLSIVGHNLVHGRKYRFLLPSSVRDWQPLVSSHYKLLQEYCRNDQLVFDNCKFRSTISPVINGCGLYHLDTAELSTKSPIIYEQIRSSIDNDDWFGYVIPPSMEPQSDTVMDPFHLQHARASFEQMWRNGKPIP